MSKNTTNTSSNERNNNNSINSNNNTSFSYNTNTQNNQQQDFNDSVNRVLDQTKDNINRSIEESRNQISHFNTIVNDYPEQTLHAAKEISERFIESQKSIFKLFSIRLKTI